MRLPSIKGIHLARGATISTLSKTTFTGAAGSSRGAPVRFEQAAAASLRQFQAAVAALFAATAEDTRRAADVERAFGVDRKLGWQMHRIANEPNPLAVAMNLPAAVSTNRMLKAAARKGLPTEIIERVSSAFQQVEQLISEHAGDRERFLSMVGPLIKEEAESIDLKQKKAAYRAMSHLVGVDEQVCTSCTFLHPGDEPGRLCAARLSAHIGLHRLRSTSPIFVPLIISRTSGEGETFTAGTQAPLVPDTGTYLLEEFCSPGLTVQEIHEPNMMEIAEAMGRNNSVDVVYASISRGVLSPFATPEGPQFLSSNRVNIPAEVLISDTLIHRDAFPLQHPLERRVHVYANERIGIGFGEPKYAERQSLLSVVEHSRHLGLGVQTLATPESPRHVEMIGRLCEKLGWNPDEFHVYRCRIEYPIFRSTVRVVFELPRNGAAESDAARRS